MSRPRTFHSRHAWKATGRTLLYAVGAGLVMLSWPQGASAQNQEAESVESAEPATAQSDPESETEASEPRAKRRAKRLRPAPELEGLGAILFNPPTAESLLGATPPGQSPVASTPEPPPADNAAAAAAQASSSAEPAAPIAEQEEAPAAATAPKAPEASDGAAAQSSAAGGKVVAVAVGKPEVDGAAAQSSAAGGAAVGVEIGSPTIDGAKYPFLAQDVEPLIDHTYAILDGLPALEVPPIDPDLLQFGTSYAFSGGTGTLPGTRAEVARCGVDFDGDALSAALTDVFDEAMRAGTDPSLSLPGNYLDMLQEYSDSVCCSFDPQTQRYRCGDPASFPNRQASFRGADGESMMMVCQDVPQDEVQYWNADGITYIDGSPVRAGRNCCAVSQGFLESIQLDGGGGGPPAPSAWDLQRAIQYCAPASVSMASGFGSRNGDVAATTEIYAEGTLQMFAERRNDAYRIDVDGRLSLISSVVFDDDDTNDQYTLRGQFGRLYADYRYYITPGAKPLFVLGGIDMNDAVFDLTKAGTADLAETYNAPTRLFIGAGLGRIYDIEPRIRLRKLEQVLLQHGVIKDTLPHEVARDIMVAWWTLRTELGYDQRLLYTFKVLKDAGLLVGPITSAIVYRFGQIINDSQLAHRRQGSDTHVVLRLNKRLQNDVDNEVLAVLEVHDEHVYNVTYDTELFWDVTFSIAPRTQDWADNLLSGEQVPFNGLVGGMLALNVPVGLRAYDYDAFMNKLGLWELQARFAAGYADASKGVATAPQGLAFSLGAGAEYTLFQSTTRGLSFVLNADFGRLNEKLVYAVVGGISMALGSRESYYVAPGDLGEALPFDLPLPHLVSGQ